MFPCLDKWTGVQPLPPIGSQKGHSFKLVEVHSRCWDTEPASQILQLAAINLCRGQTPKEAVTGNNPDISEDSQFEFYE
jgi:hypothetical protein